MLCAKSDSQEDASLAILAHGVGLTPVGSSFVCKLKFLAAQGYDCGFGAYDLLYDAGFSRDYGDTISLLQDIQQHIERYLDVSAPFRKFAAYYVLLSWLFDRLNTLPYLRALGK